MRKIYERFKIAAFFFALVFCTSFIKANAKTTPTLVFQQMSIEKTYGDGGFTNPVTIVTDGAISYSSSDTSVATVNGNGYVTIKGGGECSITIKAASGTNYVSGSRSYHLTVNRATPYISFSSSTVTKALGDAAFRNVLSTNADGTISYSSSNTAIAEVDSKTGYVTLIRSGSCIITAKVAEGKNYTSTEASYNLNVNDNSGGLVLAFVESKVTKTYGNAAFTNALSTNASGTITYTSSNKNVASVNSSGRVTILGAGSCVITASVSGGATSYTLTVNKAVPQMKFASGTVNKKMGDSKFKNTLTTNADGTISYSSSDTKIGVVDASGNVTVKGVGTCKITARAATGKNYTTGSASYSLVVLSADGGTNNNSNTNNGSGANGGSNISEEHIFKNTQPAIGVKIAGANKVKISWQKIAKAQKYYVYYATKAKGTYKLAKEVSSSNNSVTLSKLKKNKTYYFKVSCSAVFSGKTVYSKESNVVSKKVLGSPTKPKIDGRTQGNSAIVLFWKKQPNVKGIVIYRKVNNKRYKKLKTISGKKKSYKISLNSKSYDRTNTYYFCIRTYYLADGVKIWSKSSNSKRLH